MNTKSKIIITGAAGFIGSCMASFLQQLGFKNLILVDDFSKTEKNNNYQSLSKFHFVERENLSIFLEQETEIKAIIHFGARTDTTEINVALFEKLNTNFSKMLWHYCTQKNIDFVYASSAATYGDGKLGYEDDENEISNLKPLNPYGESKQKFDEFVLYEVAKNNAPKKWVGLKFFNVYGPNEYHKGRMASVIFHSFNQIKNNSEIKLFKSHKKNYEDGEQKRDFIYVKDILKVVEFILNTDFKNGIYNLGTGNARTFNELANAVFSTLEIEKNISYIDTPIEIRDSYQYFTEANMQKLKKAGYSKSFYSLEEGIADYIKNYLLETTYF